MSTKLSKVDNNTENLSSKMGVWFSANSITAYSVIAIVFFGYQTRQEYYWQPDTGLGYLFGIIGTSFMVLLLLYPLRKRYAFVSQLLSIQQWFKFHMLLGVVGPTFILLHCNFALGSINSRVALFSMLLMVSSGIIGRFFYGKIHRGLYGSRIQLTDIHQQKASLLNQLGARSRNDQLTQEILRLLCQYEADLIRPASVFGNFFRVTWFGFKSRHLHHAINGKLSAIENDAITNLAEKKLSTIKNFNNTADTKTKVLIAELKQLTKQYVQLVRRVAEFSFYERIFSLWHMLHLPIFILLIASASIHIYAVHNY